MKTLLKKAPKVKVSETKQAQCCAKISSNQVGCHD
jgi:hypothetical protein